MGLRVWDVGLRLRIQAPPGLRVQLRVGLVVDRMQGYSCLGWLGQTSGWVSRIDGVRITTEGWWSQIESRGFLFCWRSLELLFLSFGFQGSGIWRSRMPSVDPALVCMGFSCIHSYMHAYIHTDSYILVNSHMHMHLHMNLHSHIYICIYMYMYMYMYTYMYMYMYMFMYVIYIYAFQYTCTYTYLHTHIHTYTHAYITKVA